MKRRGFRNMLTFLLALVLTAAVVAVLSAATRMPVDAAPAAAQAVQAEAQEAGQLTAAARQGGSQSVLAGLGGFLLLLAIPTGSFLLYCRARRRGRDYRAEAGRQSYRPRADMSLRGARFVRN